MNERFKLWANSVFLQVYKDTTCKFSIVEIVADGYSKIYLSAKEWGYYFLKLHWKCNWVIRWSVTGTLSGPDDLQYSREKTYR